MRFRRNSSISSSEKAEPSSWKYIEKARTVHTLGRTSMDNTPNMLAREIYNTPYLFGAQEPGHVVWAALQQLNGHTPTLIEDALAVIVDVPVVGRYADSKSNTWR